MTRDEVMAVVRKNLSAAVLSIAPESVDPDRSMKELGANSLDVVEVVSASMRELRVKVPRAELSKLSNINQLVDLLHRLVEVRP